MQPAFSVILFTTLAGAGQGLFIALFLGECYALLTALPEPAKAFYSGGGLLAFILLLLGLLASFFHLGHPERAWRAAAMWRTSWLSREVIVLPVMMGVVVLYSIVHGVGFNPDLLTFAAGGSIRLSLALGVLGSLLALVLFLCTGMIYASIRFLREWASPLTVLNFSLLGAMSGFTLAAAWAALMQPALVRFFTLWALCLLLLAFMGRVSALIRNARLQPHSTLQTAIGIRHQRIQQKSQGFMGGSFNTREFFHKASVLMVQRIKQTFLALGFALPAVLLMASLLVEMPGLLLVAVIVQMLGLIAERWYFFAEARHPQNLYYQTVG